ncbi:KICSTOR complex protein kaptin isoform X2 [Folsomia candida]|uniref:KICSTOR complex protein kaptin isoform X2 n=1 Tax=Folsomia candida TaxID=158441 RepID=UPI001604A3D1|nr:KICSTOR complex protein kaptin isoform X2 [Folsomia candida]
MKEEQFNQLPSQGTIYSVGRLGSHLIIGTGNYGKIYAHIWASIMQQLPLQNLPYECDIISIDAYIDAFPVLAVAYVQKCNASTNGAIPDGMGKGGFVTSHLNIYSTWISVDQDSPTSTSSTSSDGSRIKSTFHPKEEFHSSQFELLAQNCTNFLLDYIPYHLYHIPVVKENGNFGNILLISGSDKKIHSYEADEDNLTFIEVPVKTYFPELAQTFPSICTRILIQPVNELTRITMCGLESGNLLIWVVTSKFHRRRRMDSETTVTSGSITPSKSIHDAFEGMSISETKDTTSTSRARDIIQLWEKSNKSTNHVTKSDESSPESACAEDGECMTDSMLESLDESFETIEHYYEGLITSIKSYTDGFSLNIIVASALSPTYVYTNVIEEHFRAGSPLKFSSRWDAVECCCVEDVDRDGENEIIIGTFGCALLVYKYMDEILPEWVIVCKRILPRNILAIEFVSPDLLVVTGLGLHVINYDTSAYFTNRPGTTTTTANHPQPIQ